MLVTVKVPLLIESKIKHFNQIEFQFWPIIITTLEVILFVHFNGKHYEFFVWKTIFSLNSNCPLKTYKNFNKFFISRWWSTFLWQNLAKKQYFFFKKKLHLKMKAINFSKIKSWTTAYVPRVRKKKKSLEIVDTCRKTKTLKNEDAKSQRVSFK